MYVINYKQFIFYVRQSELKEQWKDVKIFLAISLLIENIENDLK